MDFELRAAKAKWEKEQKEKKEKARKRLEQERKAREEAAKRQEAIEAAQRIRRIEETAAAIAASAQELEDLEAGDGIIFNRVFKALLVAGKGDKIRLPASSFEQLSSQSAIDKGPMFFEVSAVHHGSRPSTSSSAASHLEQHEINGESSKPRSTHAGVLEFTAEEGVVELPPHVWHNAGFSDPEYLSKNIHRGIPEARVRYVRLPKGTYAKLQPEGGDFADVFNHKAVLETELRQHASLTEGDLLTVHHGGVDYGLRVLELKPRTNVSVLETDLEVDVVGPGETTSSPQSRLSPLTLGKAESGLVEEGKYTYYRFTIDPQTEKGIEARTLDILVHLEVETKGGSDADADLYVAAHPLLYPTKHQHQWSSHDVGSKVICMTASPSTGESTKVVGAGGYSIGVFGFQGNTRFRLWVEARAAEARVSHGQRLGANAGDKEASSSASQLTQSDDGFSLCQNCKQLVPGRTLMLHEAYCRRHNFACQHPGCGVVLRKGDKDKHVHCSKCGLGLTSEELAKHMKVFHERLKCECGVELEMEAMVEHRASSCPKRLVSCRFCGDMVQAGAPADNVRDRLRDLTQHESECGARTADCDACGRAIMLKEMDIHIAAAHSGGQSMHRGDSLFTGSATPAATLPANEPLGARSGAVTNQPGANRVTDSSISIQVECPICSTKFGGADREQQLNSHLDDEHFKTQLPTPMDLDGLFSPAPTTSVPENSLRSLTVSCPICGMAVHSERDLSQHIDLVH
ncbi:uncharacterized protein [Physcomitrium patens]|uniref:C2H2-type domain-containing protein n=1 Tax=Physcomitrium patens TaxID=3218 RepID=A0A2K1KSX3_PHYPA|nr:uncharacterized protein LOC112280267 [Physcomitrium patens]XP_024371341.1 uncharacterized protein LOC112280267 [Physcomitrium patens]PNR56894.1 hypothetical protein PHYPA_003886 [Physcomitrium patens]|eukprot:XP_024371340.1 uncharacterized protein LOC112280267 [Physcomitrella patens]